MSPLARRQFLIAAAGAGLLSASGARGAEESYLWGAPPVGLAWSTHGTVLSSDGFRNVYAYENRIEAIDGNLVTYVESTQNLVDDLSWQTRIQTFRFWETRWEEKPPGGSRTDREALGAYEPKRLLGFWPWRVGTTLETQLKSGTGLYRLEAFEDLSDERAIQRRAARFSYESNEPIPTEATFWCDAEHGLYLKLRASDGYFADEGEIVTREVTLDLVSWSTP